MTGKLMTAAFLLLTLGSVSCKKTVQQVQEDLVTQLIVNNIWVVTNYTEGTNNLTAGYSEYDFKFNRDGSLNARKTGQADLTGTWKSDATAMTITANFPASAVPVNKLSGVWNITKTTLTSVKSTRLDNGTPFYLDLQTK